MNVILIYGEQDVGKTSVCNQLKERILSCGGVLENFTAFNWLNDFKSLIFWQNQQIAIYSPGDEKGHLVDAIAFGEDNKCDTLVATVRKGIAYNDPLSNVSENNTIEWIPLKRGITIEEMKGYEADVVIKLLDKIKKV